MLQQVLQQRDGCCRDATGVTIRLPEGDIPAEPGSGVSNRSTAHRFMALSSEKLASLMKADLSKLNLLAGQTDGLHWRGRYNCLLSKL